MNKIMLIDDDPSLQLALRHLITDEGYDFCCAADGRTGLAMVEEEQPDLILLDVMMPGMNGYDVCTALRASGQLAPIIFLSAKGDIVDKSIGFKAGGDDYMVKPFDNSELLLRIEAHLRRHKGALSPEQAALQNTGQTAIGDLTISFDKYRVEKAGEVLDLTSKEFEILALLAANPGKVYTRQQIYEHIWGDENAIDTNSITVFIRRIREKIEDNASQPKYLLTVWGVGYKFAE